jgi:essential nuclear protein 1
MDDEEDDGFVDELDPKVINVYQGVGKLLGRYKSGKLPKALKIAPNLKNWEQIIGITNPPA